MILTVDIMSHTYYCLRCGKMITSTSTCPTCRLPMKRMLRVMEPAELVVEQLTLFDEQGGRNKRSHPHLRVIRGGKTN